MHHTTVRAAVSSFVKQGLTFPHAGLLWERVGRIQVKWWVWGLIAFVFLPFPLLFKFQPFLLKGIIAATDVTNQVRYKIMLRWEISWYRDKDVWNITSQNIAQTRKKKSQIPYDFPLIYVNIACSHLPRYFLAILWCLQFPHLFSALLPEPCACLFFTTFLWRFCYSNKFCIISFIK